MTAYSACVWQHLSITGVYLLELSYYFTLNNRFISLSLKDIPMEVWVIGSSHLLAWRNW